MTFSSLHEKETGDSKSWGTVEGLDEGLEFEDDELIYPNDASEDEGSDDDSDADQRDTKKSRKLLAPDEEEAALQSLLFPSVFANGDGTSLATTYSADGLSIIDESRQSKRSRQSKPAWVDSESQALQIDLMDKQKEKGSAIKRKLRKAKAEQSVAGDEYEERLRTQFERVHSRADTSWADVADQHSDEDRSSDDSGDDWSDDDDGNENAERFLRSTGRRTRGAGGLLPPNLLRIVGRVDLNKKHPTKSKITSVKFHPSGQLALVASTDSGVRIFGVDGKHNPKVQGVVLRDLPVTCAEFTGDGKEVICTGRRKFFYSYNLESGHVQRIDNIHGSRDRSVDRMIVSADNRYLAALGSGGMVHVLSRQTKQSIAAFKLNGSVTDAQFYSDEDRSQLYAIGSDGDVYLWDLNTRRCVHVFPDEGSIHSTAIAVSNRFVATGSQNGIINVYDVKRTLDETPPVQKCLKNFTTSISRLHFNHDSQILAGTTTARESGLKLFHCPSITTFSNWPTDRTPLHTVTSLDFSPHSGFLSIGNQLGRALLYRLEHYGSS